MLDMLAKASKKGPEPIAEMKDQQTKPEQSNDLDQKAKKDIEEDDPIMSSLQIRMGLGLDEVEKASEETILDIQNQIISLQDLAPVDSSKTQRKEADIKKSYCSVHLDQEIVFACYQCQKMCCQMCDNKHDGHTKAFFKDQYIYTCQNYDKVEQISQQDL